jgi:hypothetical protein
VPESGRLYGAVSGSNLGKVSVGKRVTVAYEELDCYGRSLDKILIIGQDTNLPQVTGSFVWHYKSYADGQSTKDRAAYAAAKIDTRFRDRGCL